MKYNPKEVITPTITGSGVESYRFDDRICAYQCAHFATLNSNYKKPYCLLFHVGLACGMSTIHPGRTILVNEEFGFVLRCTRCQFTFQASDGIPYPSPPPLSILTIHEILVDEFLIKFKTPLAFQVARIPDRERYCAQHEDLDVYVSSPTIEGLQKSIIEALAYIWRWKVAFRNDDDRTENDMMIKNRFLALVVGE